MKNERQFTSLALILGGVIGCQPMSSAEDVPNTPAFRHGLDFLVEHAIHFLAHDRVGVVIGVAFWTEDVLEDGSRAGAFEVGQVLSWDLSDPSPDDGQLINFTSPTFQELSQTMKGSNELRRNFNANIETGQKIPAVLLFQAASGSATVSESAFHLPDTSEATLRDLLEAAEVAKSRIGPAEFSQWRGKVSGPLGTAVLLRSVPLVSELVESVEVAEFALEVLEGGDPRQFGNATMVLRRTPDGVLGQLPAHRLRDTLTRTAGLLAEDVERSNLLNHVEALTEITGRLSADRRRELAGLIHGHLAPPVDRWHADRNERRAARAAERAADPAEQRHRQVEERLGTRDPLADYEGPGQTPDEGRWIELRRRLEAMAR